MDDDNKKKNILYNFSRSFYIYQSQEKVMIYNSENYYEKSKQILEIKSQIKLIEILGSSNILIYVDLYLPSIINIYDIEKKKNIGEIRFSSEITSIKIFAK